MALLHLNFESQYLKGNTDVAVILPDCPREQGAEAFYSSNKKYKVLWLLHGTFGDYSDWLRKTNIELYACERELAVVMPSALNSDYGNWSKFACGFYMEDYLIKELMPLVYHWFPISDKKEDNFIAGLSMGAQGTARYGTWYPERFAAMALLSGPPNDWRNLPEEWTKGKWSDRTRNQIDAEGGMERLLNSHRNVWDRFWKLAEEKQLPPCYCCMGTKDFLYEDWYLPFKEHAKKKRADITFEEIEGYGHEWRFWDITIQHALDFFKITDRKAGNAF